MLRQYSDKACLTWTNHFGYSKTNDETVSLAAFATCDGPWHNEIRLMDDCASGIVFLQSCFFAEGDDASSLRDLLFSKRTKIPKPVSWWPTGWVAQGMWRNIDLPA